MEEKGKTQRSQDRPDALSDVEIQLESSLSPVKPNPEFIQHLRDRLSTNPVMVLERESHLLDVLIALGTVMGGILILVGLLRGIYEVLVATGVIRSD